MKSSLTTTELRASNIRKITSIQKIQYVGYVSHIKIIHL